MCNIVSSWAYVCAILSLAELMCVQYNESSWAYGCAILSLAELMCVQ